MEQTIVYDTKRKISLELESCGTRSRGNVNTMNSKFRHGYFPSRRVRAPVGPLFSRATQNAFGEPNLCNNT